MSRRASLAWVFSVCGVALACGGRSSVEGPNFGESGAAGSAGAAAGPTGAGGAPTGGMNTGGMNTGGANTGGAIGACAQGQACVPGGTCTAPAGNGCTTMCKCPPNGTYSCMTACSLGAGGGATCAPGEPCFLGSACSTVDPNDPNCLINCYCQNSGYYSCNVACGGTEGFGGGPGACGSCVFEQDGVNVCKPLWSQCNQTPACDAAAKCVVDSGCLSALNVAQCAYEACPWAQPGQLEPALKFLSCAGCVCTFECGTLGCSMTGAGGVGGGPSSCGDCALKALQQNACPKEQATCATTPGCSQVGQCAITKGCFGQTDPTACIDTECTGSPAAKTAVIELAACIACGPCNASCGFPCGGGGTGGAGGSAGGGPMDCEQCAEGPGQQQCASEIKACLIAADCEMFVKCIEANEAYEVCAKKFPAGESLYQKAVACILCDACGDVCAGVVPPNLCMP